jgi:hypothetical protein
MVALNAEVFQEETMISCGLSFFMVVNEPLLSVVAD